MYCKGNMSYCRVVFTLGCCTAIVLLTLFISSCSSDRPTPANIASDATGPTILPLEPILLDETDDYLGNPRNLVVDTVDGSFLVADFFENRIFRFARDGSLVQRYGRPGPGPAEFMRLGPAFILNDSVVVGVDSERRLFKMFSRENEDFLGSFPYEGIVGLGVSVVGNVVVAPAMDVEDLHSVIVWRPEQDLVESMLDLPLPYRQSLAGAGAFAGIYGLGNVAAWSDTVLMGMGGMNELYLATLSGETLDTLRPPRARRRGVPSGAQARIDRVGDESISYRDRIEMLSILHGLGRMPDGAIVLVHHDATVKGEPPVVDFPATVYVSVLSSGRETACVDGPVSFANEMRAVHTVSRDTLYLLDRTLNEAEDGLTTRIRRYEIDTSGCDWVPVG